MTYFAGLPSLAFDSTSESSGGSSRTQSLADSGYLSDSMSSSYTTPMQQLAEPTHQTTSMQQQAEPTQPTTSIKQLGVPTQPIGEPSELVLDLPKRDGFGHSQPSLVKALAAMPNDRLLSNSVTRNGNYTKPLIPLTCEENTPVEILVPQKDYDSNNNFLELSEASMSPGSSSSKGSRGSANHRAATKGSANHRAATTGSANHRAATTGSANHRAATRVSANHRRASTGNRSAGAHCGKRSLNDADRRSHQGQQGQGQQQKTPVKRGRKLGQGKVPQI